MVVPALRPETKPPEDTEAMPGVLLLHVPPPTVSANPVVKPTHTVRIPVIVVGLGLTVNTIVALLVPAV
jgi:hypothetical protein